LQVAIPHEIPEQRDRFITGSRPPRAQALDLVAKFEEHCRKVRQLNPDATDDRRIFEIWMTQKLAAVHVLLFDVMGRLGMIEGQPGSRPVLSRVPQPAARSDGHPRRRGRPRSRSLSVTARSQIERPGNVGAARAASVSRSPRGAYPWVRVMFVFAHVSWPPRNPGSRHSSDRMRVVNHTT
jgi:hypothetical protein